MTAMAGALRTPARELAVRHARRDGRSIAILRVVDCGASCRVDAEVYPVGLAPGEPSRPGPYEFPDRREALAFLTEAADALVALGCDVESA